MRVHIGTIAFLSGMTLALLYLMYLTNQKGLSSSYTKPPKGQNVLRIRNNTDLNRFESKPVIFITTSEYSTIQSALLTKLAHALYPVRSNALWIVVSLPVDSAEERYETRDTHQHRSSDKTSSKNDTLRLLHSPNLDESLARFGIPYVLLDMNEMENRSDWSWAGHELKLSRIAHVKGLQMGLLWAVRNVPCGIVVLGDEHYGYHSALFSELQQTKIASTWPVGFGSLDAAFTTPVATKDETSGQLQVLGHYSGEILSYGSIPLEIGAFAVDLEYLRDNVPYTNYWKLAISRAFTNQDFHIPLNSIQVQGNAGSEIYVWRTTADMKPWPEAISITRRMKNTNIESLLRNALGPTYFAIKDRIQFKELRFYDEYSFETDLKYFM